MTSSLSRRGTLDGGYWIRKTSSAYSADQVVQWLECINFPELFTAQDIAAGTFPTTLENLEIIMRLQLVAFLYENTAMHYSAKHSMDISPEGLYHRLVVDRRGSYCFGLNGLLFQMLRGLGYRTYSGSARINLSKEASAAPNFTAPLHMVIFVQPDKDSNTTYLVDAGCGGSGPTRPILLSDAADNIVIGTSPSEKHRLTKGAHPDASLAVSSDTRINVPADWRLEVLHEKPDSPEGTWKIVYSFSEKESFPADFESANLAVYMLPSGLFWENVLCSKHFWLDQGEANERPWRGHMGRMGMEGSTVRRHIGSQSEVLRTMSSESDRISALKELFGLEISGKEREHIRGRDAVLAMD